MHAGSPRPKFQRPPSALYHQIGYLGDFNRRPVSCTRDLLIWRSLVGGSARPSHSHFNGEIDRSRPICMDRLPFAR